jgi:hypothetical protein
MTCKELVELATEYFEGTLDDAVQADFEAHLGLCPGCVTYLEQLRTTLRVAHDVHALERRPEVARLLEAFRDWRGSQASTG